jgi:uncharacterized protein YyaL (SSP411 family)
LENLRSLYRAARASSLRELYWEFTVRRSRLAKLRRPEFAVLSRHVASEAAHLEYGLAHLTVAPSNDETRLASAIAWVLRAQQATPDAGVSLGYFPLEVEGGWYPSYPETTGYLITSLLAYAARYRHDDVRAAALAMAAWEIEVQMPSGAVQGGALVSRDRQTASAFNTGMVLDGWCTAYETTRETRFLEAAAAAARFLAADMDEAGYFRTNGAFVSQGETKTYNCLCAWSMLRTARLKADPALERAAVRAVEAALRRQRENGWFANNCLTASSIPLTHTIGYALQGVFEVGVLTGREDFVAAAERGLTNILARARQDGFLPGRFDACWRPAANFVCLTGSSQLAVVAYRFAEVFGRRELLPSADRLLSFVKATQRLEGEDANMIGAIAGSYPILGGYMTAGFPNWATKYFIDALLLRSSL